MKRLSTALLLFIAFNTNAQHCPWDCTGLLLIKTGAEKETLYIMQADLVDENKEVIVDTIYGTGLLTFDTCNLLKYEDFMAYRKSKISLHHWYAYDTLYHFAEGLYLIKFNRCKYKDKKIYLHFYDRHTRGLREHYIEIPVACMLSPHEFSSELRSGNSADLSEWVDDKIMYMDCARWKLYEQFCK